MINTMSKTAIIMYGIEANEQPKEEISMVVMDSNLNIRRRVTKGVDIVDVISGREQLNNLIRIASKDALISKWFPSSDVSTSYKIELNELKCIPEVPSFESLSQLHSWAYKSCETPLSIGLLNPNCMILLDHGSSDFSGIADVFPSTEEVIARISNIELLITFHSADGFNFSQEFSHVYRGKSDQQSVFEDTLTICKRALLAADTSMTIRKEDIDIFTGFITLKNSHISVSIICPFSMTHCSPQ